MGRYGESGRVRDRGGRRRGNGTQRSSTREKNFLREKVGVIKESFHNGQEGGVRESFRSECGTSPLRREGTHGCHEKQRNNTNKRL